MGGGGEERSVDVGRRYVDSIGHPLPIVALCCYGPLLSRLRFATLLVCVRLWLSPATSSDSAVLHSFAVLPCSMFTSHHLGSLLRRARQLGFQPSTPIEPSLGLGSSLASSVVSVRGASYLVSLISMESLPDARMPSTPPVPATQFQVGGPRWPVPFWQDLAPLLESANHQDLQDGLPQMLLPPSTFSPWPPKLVFPLAP